MLNNLDNEGYREKNGCNTQEIAYKETNHLNSEKNPLKSNSKSSGAHNITKSKNSDVATFKPDYKLNFESNYDQNEKHNNLEEQKIAYNDCFEVSLRFM